MQALDSIIGHERTTREHEQSRRIAAQTAATHEQRSQTLHEWQLDETAERAAATAAQGRVLELMQAQSLRDADAHAERLRREHDRAKADAPLQQSRISRVATLDSLPELVPPPAAGAPEALLDLGGPSGRLDRAARRNERSPQESERAHVRNVARRQGPRERAEQERVRAAGDRYAEAHALAEHHMGGIIRRLDGSTVSIEGAAYEELMQLRMRGEPTELNGSSQ